MEQETTHKAIPSHPLCCAISGSGFPCRSFAVPGQNTCLAHSSDPAQRAAFLALQKSRSARGVAARREKKSEKRPKPDKSTEKAKKALEKALALLRGASAQPREAHQ